MKGTVHEALSTFMIISYPLLFIFTNDQIISEIKTLISC